MQIGEIKKFINNKETMIECGNILSASYNLPKELEDFVKYILGKNAENMTYNPAGVMTEQEITRKFQLVTNLEELMHFMDQMREWVQDKINRIAESNPENCNPSTLLESLMKIEEDNFLAVIGRRWVLDILEMINEFVSPLELQLSMTSWKVKSVLEQ